MPFKNALNIRSNKTLNQQKKHRLAFSSPSFLTLATLIFALFATPHHANAHTDCYCVITDNISAKQFYEQGMFILHGKNGNVDNKDAQRWIQRAADMGYPLAQQYVATHQIFDYDATSTARSTVDTGVKMYTKLANEGDAGMQFALGMMYKTGSGVEQDYAKAFKWFNDAARQGNAGAQHFLGVMYEEGEGVPQDYSKARQWYYKAAMQDEGISLYNLGLMHLNGKGVAQNYDHAIDWFKKSDTIGYVGAQYKLGELFDQGLGVPQNYETAIRYYQKAADDDYLEAMYRLGEMYEQGIGLQQDYKLAKAMYQKTCDIQHYEDGCAKVEALVNKGY